MIIYICIFTISEIGHEQKNQIPLNNDQGHGVYNTTT